MPPGRNTDYSVTSDPNAQANVREAKGPIHELCIFDVSVSAVCMPMPVSSKPFFENLPSFESSKGSRVLALLFEFVGMAKDD